MTRRPSIDGFVPRRPASTPEQPQTAVGGAGLPRTELGAVRRDRPVATTGLVKEASDPEAQSIRLSRTDIDDSLKSIDEPEQKLSRKERRKQRASKHSKRRKIIKWVIIAIIIAVLGVAGWVAFKALTNAESVFKGSILGLVQQQKLKQDENGRSNVLVLGTSEDDPGHGGAYLTDSIMVLSVDQTNKNAYMVSIPRDLYVKYGMACNSGYQGKINEYFNCVNEDYNSDSAEEERQSKTREFIGGILGIDIQYSAHVNYSVMRDLVSALGSITVNIQGSGGAPGVMDSNFDWKCKGGNAYASLATMKKNCPPNGHFIDYPNGPVELDAEHALYLAQARGDSSPTYGLGNSNFDREQNQQKIIKAIREKALSSGTLTNIGKVTGLMDAIGKNLRTNFDTSEIRTLMNLAQDIPSESITSLNLLDDDIMDGSATPVAGMYNFTQLQAYIQKKFNANPITREDPHIMVLNASGVAGAAQTQADKLTALGMTVDYVGNAPADAQEGTNVIYRVAKNGKPLTAAKLSQLYGAKVTVVDSIPGVTIGDDTDYVVIVGKATDTAASSSAQ